MHEGHRNSPHLSLTFACLQGPGPNKALSQQRKGRPRHRQLECRCRSGRFRCPPRLETGEERERVVRVRRRPQGSSTATSVASGNVSGTKSFNTSLSGMSLWAEIADQAGKGNSVNVGRLGDSRRPT